MIARCSPNVCPASLLAKSILDLWLSGDHYLLRLELERVTQMPISPETDDESDRIELLRSMAQRMREAPDLSESRCQSPRVATWLDLLHHLSSEAYAVN